MIPAFRDAATLRGRLVPPPFLFVGLEWKWRLVKPVAYKLDEADFLGKQGHLIATTMDEAAEILI